MNCSFLADRIAITSVEMHFSHKKEGHHTFQDPITTTYLGSSSFSKNVKGFIGNIFLFCYVFCAIYKFPRHFDAQEI